MFYHDHLNFSPTLVLVLLCCTASCALATMPAYMQVQGHGIRGGHNLPEQLPGGGLQWKQGRMPSISNDSSVDSNSNNSDSIENEWNSSSSSGVSFAAVNKTLKNSSSLAPHKNKNKHHHRHNNQRRHGGGYRTHVVRYPRYKTRHHISRRKILQHRELLQAGYNNNSNSSSDNNRSQEDFDYETADLESYYDFLQQNDQAVDSEMLSTIDADWGYSELPPVRADPTIPSAYLVSPGSAPPIINVFMLPEQQDSKISTKEDHQDQEESSSSSTKSESYDQGLSVLVKDAFADLAKYFLRLNNLFST